MTKHEIYNVYPQHSFDAGVAQSTDVRKIYPYFFPYNQIIANWEPLQYAIIKGKGFYDYQANTHGIRLFSQRLKDLLDSYKSVDDKIQWLEVTIKNNEEIRPYYILHFYEAIDVIDYELSGWDGKFFNKSKVFNKKKIQNYNIFSIPELGYEHCLIIKRKIVAEIKKQKLSGMNFRPAEISYGTYAMEISIEISYKYKENDDSNVSEKRYTILPDQYFDMSMSDENESLDIDTLPQYDHAIEYLLNLEPNLNRKKISETKIVIREGIKTKIISEKFWQGGNNCLIECLDLYPDNYSHLFIIGTQIYGQYLETTRIFKEVGMDTFDLTTHSVLDTQTE
jgi:hypothetical protein